MQIKNTSLTKLAVCLLVIIGFWLTVYMKLTSPRTIYRAADQSQKFTAEIKVYREIQYFGISALLEVRLEDGSEIFSTILLRNLDSIEVLTSEITGIEWSGNTLVLHLNRNHYTGPQEFKNFDVVKH